MNDCRVYCGTVSGRRLVVIFGVFRSPRQNRCRSLRQQNSALLTFRREGGIDGRVCDYLAGECGDLILFGLTMFGVAFDQRTAGIGRYFFILQ